MTPLLSTAFLRTQSDARLASLAREGHALAFEVIVERYRRPLHAHCRRVLPDARAEDVVQQTFLSAWTAMERGENVRELRAWLYRIAHNTSINTLKRSGYDYDELRDSLEHEDTPEADVERRAVIRETLAGVAALPDKQREALLRTAVGGASQAEIARDLGVTDGAVRQLVHRARATLRAAATAITPFPLAAWAATAGASGGGAAVSERIGELAAGAGTAGVGGLLLKGGTAVVVAGAIAAAPATVHHVRSDGTARAADAPAKTTGEAPSSTHGATPVSRTGTPDTAGKTRTGSTGKGEGKSKGKDRSGSGSGPGTEDHSGSGRSGGDDHTGGRSGSGGSGGGGGSGRHHGRERNVSGGDGSGGTNDSSSTDSSGDSTSGTDGTPVVPSTDDNSGSGGSGDTGPGSGDSGSSGGSGSDDPVPTTDLGAGAATPFAPTMGS